MSEDVNLLTEAAKHVEGGYSELARGAGVNVRTVRRWEEAGRLPQSCLNNFRDYHRGLARATGNKITAKQFLEWTRRSWRRYYEEGGSD